MLNHAAFKTGLLLAVLILAATNVAQAKIILSQPAFNAAPSLAGPPASRDYLNMIPLDQGQTTEVSKAITLNLGPFHFQEVVRHPLKACPT